MNIKKVAYKAGAANRLISDDFKVDHVRIYFCVTCTKINRGSYEQIVNTFYLYSFHLLFWFIKKFSKNIDLQK
jgi:hypothetical protein